MKQLNANPVLDAAWERWAAAPKEKATANSETWGALVFGNPN